jgi:hypothetical protein
MSFSSSSLRRLLIRPFINNPAQMRQPNVPLIAPPIANEGEIAQQGKERAAGRRPADTRR